MQGHDMRTRGDTTWKFKFNTCHRIEKIEKEIVLSMQKLMSMFMFMPFPMLK